MEYYAERGARASPEPHVLPRTFVRALGRREVIDMLEMTSWTVWYKRFLLALNTVCWSLPIMAVTGLDAFTALSLSAMAWTWLTAYTDQ